MSGLNGFTSYNGFYYAWLDSEKFCIEITLPYQIQVTRPKYRHGTFYPSLENIVTDILSKFTCARITFSQSRKRMTLLGTAKLLSGST